MNLRELSHKITSIMEADQSRKFSITVATTRGSSYSFTIVHPMWDGLAELAQNKLNALLSTNRLKETEGPWFIKSMTIL